MSKRNFRIRLRRPSDVSYIAAKVVVNGRQVPVIVAKQRYRTIRGKVLKLRRLTAQVDLRGLPKGTFRVQITAIATSLRTIRGTRPRPCAARCRPTRVTASRACPRAPARGWARRSGTP